ncbi:hypothetical protein B0H13DRAFT_1884866 [Mycena leptocephala]|nr:hypothetical protein B0H13DRAFT_1884866 [Mycena leptocephala]
MRGSCPYASSHHVAFNTIPSSTALHAGLLANARLQCIIFLTLDMYQMTEVRPHAEVVRFVWIAQTDFHFDWLQDAATGDDYWTLAEAFIAAKQAGNVDTISTSDLTRSLMMAFDVVRNCGRISFLSGLLPYIGAKILNWPLIHC